MNRFRGLNYLAAAGSLAALVGLTTLWGCGKQSAGEPIKQLTVLTPHNEAIRRTFATGFSAWHMEKRGEPVHIAWVYRGTPRCVEYVQGVSKMRTLGANCQNPDVMFGRRDHGPRQARRGGTVPGRWILARRWPAFRRRSMVPRRGTLRAAGSPRG